MRVVPCLAMLALLLVPTAAAEPCNVVDTVLFPTGVYVEPHCLPVPQPWPVDEVLSTAAREFHSLQQTVRDLLD